MRIWIGRRIGPWRAGVSFEPEDFRRIPRRLRPVLLAVLIAAVAIAPVLLRH
jgi:hypothetical protein